MNKKTQKEELLSLIMDKLSNFECPETYNQRTVADLIEIGIKKIAEDYYGEEYIKSSSVKSTDDFSLKEGKIKNLFDIKTHYDQEMPGFSMPNLISVLKLKKMLENNEIINYIHVNYERNGIFVKINKIEIFSVCEIDWKVLTIGALGKGQLQIKDANKEIILTNIGKEKWESILKENVVNFYKKQILKIDKDISLWLN